MAERKQHPTVLGWCRDGIHNKCRKVVRQSDTEDLVCTCPCPHLGNHGD